MKKLVMILIVLGLALTPRVAAAACQPHVTAQCCLREEDNCGQYERLGVMTVSAYHPTEDSYRNNWRSVPLKGLVGEIVAAPTGSGLLGRTIAIVTEDGILTRTVDDTGCSPGRIDLLVAGDAEMAAWGLRECEVWLLE